MIQNPWKGRPQMDCPEASQTYTNRPADR